MGLLRNISDLVAELLGNRSQGATFGEIDRSAAERPAPQFRPDRHEHPEIEIDATPEFELALELVKQKAPFVFVTGRAGTGKTTFIRWMCSQVDGNIAVVAPTGLAALTAGGQTIHSFFRLPPRFIPLEEVRRLNNRAIYERLDLLVIDEVSMVRADMLDVIDRFMRLNGPHADKPFGGVPVLAVGDLHQLPPIVGDRDLECYLDDNYRSPYFFSARSVPAVRPQSVQLTKVFRQSDESFLDMLNQIREGRNPETAIQKLNKLCLDREFDDPNWTVLVPRRDKALHINERRLNELSGPTRESVGNIEGEFFGRQRVDQLSEEQLDKQLPSPYRLKLRTGARVIFTKNDLGKRWVNGTTGTVREIKDGSVYIELDDPTWERVVEVQVASWERIRYEYDQEANRLTKQVIGSFTQYPLALGWAMTIYKAQGQTLSRAVVDLDGGAFAPGMTYVALSRCKTIEGLKLKQPIQMSDVQCDEIIRRVYERLREEDVAARLRVMRTAD